MIYGLNQKQFDWLEKNILMPLKQKDSKVFCFGSRARNDHHEFSDIDIMAESDQDLSKLIAQLKENAENSNFPYKIDLVSFKDFNPEYLNSYLENRVQL